MTRSVLALAVGLALVAAACDPGARQAEPFEGIWRSDGWGTVLVVEGGDVEIFERTGVHCLSVATGGARGIDEVLTLEGERLLMTDSNRAVRFDRIDVLPAECADPAGSPDPALVAQVLVATLEEQLVAGLDPGWEERTADLASRATGLDDLALLDLLAGTIEPLGGAVRVGTESGSIRPPRPPFEPPDEAELAGGGALATWDAPADVGYLAFSRVGPFAPNLAESERILIRALDEELTGGSVVLDLRAADGGVLGHALAVATRFVDAPAVFGSMEARAGTGFVPAGELAVNPLPTGPYGGNVFVLIGPETRGVAEILVMVLRDLPTVTVLGEATAGDPGPPLIRFLPNGWSVSVPNLRVRDSRGDLVGPIQPDVAGGDPLRQALEMAG